MSKLPDAAYTGNSSKGHPYEGDLGKAVDFDLYESSSPIVGSDNSPEIFGPYGYGARNLLNHSSIERGDRVLDLGSRTGISTLEIFRRQSDITILGINQSEGMDFLAKYKFSQNNGQLVSEIDNEQLLRYWRDFRTESKPYGNNVEFLMGDFEKIDLQHESFDSAVASQFMHWSADLSKPFTQLAKFLKQMGKVAWNSSSHWYNDSKFPSAEFGFRYNDFMSYVLDSVSSGGGIEFKDLFSLSKPEHNIESIKAITSEQGFDTEQEGIYLMQVDFIQFVSRHVPAFVRSLIVSTKIDDQELESRVNESIKKAILDPKTLGDTRHRYEIHPVFVSVKKN